MSRIDLPGYGIDRTPDYPPTVACVVCRADEIELDDWHLCAECRPLEEESCEAYETRIAGRRAK